MHDDLYREEILEHYRNPLNFGELDSYSISAKQTNPFCGDEIAIYLIWKDAVIKEISFIGKGCAICIASASLLTEFVKGKTREQLTNFSEKDMLALLGVNVSETRKKCALLARAVLQDCLIKA